MFVWVCVCGSEKVQGVKGVCLLYTSSLLYIWSEWSRKTTRFPLVQPRAKQLFPFTVTVCGMYTLYIVCVCGLYTLSVCLYPHDSTLGGDVCRPGRRRTSMKITYAKRDLCVSKHEMKDSNSKFWTVNRVSYQSYLFNHKHSPLHWRSSIFPFSSDLHNYLALTKCMPFLKKKIWIIVYYFPKQLVNTHFCCWLVSCCSDWQSYTVCKL